LAITDYTFLHLRRSDQTCCDRETWK